MTAIGLGQGMRGPGRLWRAVGGAIWKVEHAFERAKAEARPVDDVRIRMVFILAVFAAGFIALAVGATRAALFPSETRVGRISTLLPGGRADLTDRNGHILAVDLPAYNLYLDPKLIWDSDEITQVLGPLLPESARKRMRDALAGQKRMKVFGPLTVEQRRAIDNLGLPGVAFEAEARRSYPLGATAAHLIGFAGAGGVGLSGAEKALDQRLADEASRGPVALAMDVRVQAALEDELRDTANKFQAKGAVGLVTNVRTGEVLAMSSWPDDEPARLELSALTRNNLAANARLEMGSIMKVFSVAIGLDSGTASLNTMYDVRSPVVLPGQTINDYHASIPHMTLTEVFTHSSNIGTSRLALQYGAPTMSQYFRDFGLLDRAPIELKDSAAPLAGGKWTANIVASRSFGHAIAVTPLQVAAGMGAIMNGGEYVPLTILRRDAPPAGRRVISEQTSQQMLDLMRLNAVEGTGRSADAAAPGYRVGGKTGTGEKPSGGGIAREKLISSFAAVFPTDGPLDADRYYVLILVDEPKPVAGRPTGGVVAAPAVGRVVNRIAPFLGVQRKLPSAAVVPSAAPPASPALDPVALEGTIDEPPGAPDPLLGSAAQ